MLSLLILTCIVLASLLLIPWYAYSGMLKMPIGMKKDAAEEFVYTHYRATVTQATKPPYS